MGQTIIDDIPTDCALWFPEYILGKKWVMKILVELINASNYDSGSMSYTDITDHIPEISSRTLSRRLTEMSESGLIIVHDNPEHPTKVRYSLSPAGRDMIPILAAVRRWSLQYGNCDDEECLADECRHVNGINQFISTENITNFFTVKNK